ncbi:hypothetical protein [Litchfieldia alkalitelluris]|uniref:hypothetical protein n=1 Tax=Litchfieldia alkalitelluris TaxID=304268 RepID=UPI000996F344|nr:hypothetical protein [Litchfieldia alkalitelluris]
MSEELQHLEQTTEIELNSYKVILKDIVDSMREQAINFPVTNKSDIKTAFSNRSSFHGIYIWYATCNPNHLIKTWQKRNNLYDQYYVKNNSSSTCLKTEKGDPIKFRLPRINPYWRRNEQLTNHSNKDMFEVPIYIGKAQGEKENLIKRLESHCETSIQTSSLKLFKTSTPKQTNKIINDFLTKDTLLIKQLKLANIRCEAMIIHKDHKDRFLTYERILREVLDPLIGEE